MTPLLALPLIALAWLAWNAYVAERDRKALKVFTGALFARSVTLMDQGSEAEGKKMRELYYAVSRAEASVAARPKFPLEDAEWALLNEVTSPLFLERLLAVYGTHYATYDALCRLTSRVRKVRLRKP